MLDSLGSTSWHHRHLESFRRLAGLLRREGPPRPCVMIIGPGGVSSVLAPLLNDAAATRASKLRLLVGDAARYADQLVRRLPMVPLRSLEPEELVAECDFPHELVVVDRSQRILSAVHRRMPHARCVLCDIQMHPPPQTADAVVAFNVVCRLASPERGMKNVLAAVRPGGWLLVDDRSAQSYMPADAGLEPQGDKIHRRRAQHAGV